VLAYNLMMFANRGRLPGCDSQRQRRQVKQCFGNLIASIKKEWRGYRPSPSRRGLPRCSSTRERTEDFSFSPALAGVAFQASSSID